jgi:hypothetical protein
LICAALDFAVTINSHVMAGPEQTMHENQLGPAEMKKPRFRGASVNRVNRSHSPWGKYYGHFIARSIARNVIRVNYKMS